jgi:glycosyltransferase involved in cell wall biosynthesis
MLISVIIPTKNRARLARKAVSSVLRQKGLWKDLKTEILLIDDGSKPSLSTYPFFKKKNLTIIKNYSGIHCPARARNLGLKRAKGDLIAFLDSDDFWEKTFLKSSIEVLKKEESAATICLTKPFFDGPYLVLLKLKSFMLNVIRNYVLLTCWLLNKGKLPESAFFLSHISSIVFKSEFLRGIKFDEKTKSSEDWEFVSRFLSKGKISIIGRYLSFFRYTQGSNTNKGEVLRSRWADYERLLARVSPEARKGLIYRLFLLYIALLKLVYKQ